MDITIIPDTWPPRHNVPTEEPPPPPFGTRQNREKECCGCGLVFRGTGLWCPTCRATPVEPRSTRHLAANRTWIAEVEGRRRLTALVEGLCLECDYPVDDVTEIWHPACAPEKGM